tara:strand:- start:119 stop:730 length:612 start_codon:yes stop_codon:yes gene_type:complete
MKKTSLLLIVLLSSFLVVGQSKKIGQMIEAGKLKYQLNDYHGAIQDFNEAIALNDKNPIAYYERGKAKDKLGDFYGAVQDFDSAISEDNKYFDAYVERGDVKNKKLRYKEATSDYLKALEINHDDQKTLLKLGQTQMALMSYLESIQSFNHLIELDPNNADAFYLRGLIHIHLNENDKGCKDLSKAGELGDYKAYEMINEYCK